MAHNKRAATPTQAEQFIQAARQLGADEDEATFKAKLGVIARQKVKDVPEPPDRDKKRD